MNQPIAILMGAALISAAIVSTAYFDNAKSTEVVRFSNNAMAFVDRSSMRVERICLLLGIDLLCKDKPKHEKFENLPE